MRIVLAIISAASIAASAFAEAPGKLTLVIHHTFNGKPLEFAKPGLTSPSGEEISISRLSYLLAEPSLKERDREEWIQARDWFGFVDATKGESRQELSGLPRDVFDTLRFHIGPDAKTDHGDPNVYPPHHPLHPLVNGLHWGWAGGYVYLALEGKVAGKPEPTGFSYHLAGVANRMEVTLPVEVDLARDKTVEIEFQVEKIFGGSKPLRIAEINSTHSRLGDTVAAQLKDQIEQAFRVREVYETRPQPLPPRSNASNPLIGTPYRFSIPKGVPLPELPVDFPLTNERVALGRKLFHDARLSRDGTQSCATCHAPNAAFSDRRRFSIGVDGRPGERNAMPLFNLAWKNTFFWDGRAPSLRAQALEPIQNTLEMHAALPDLVERLTSDPSAAHDFTAAFGTAEVSAERVGLALEAFVLTTTSFNSKFDRALRGETELSEQEKRGFQLFTTEYDPRRNQFGADCFHCHGGALFTDNQFHNNGLALDPRDTGRERITNRAEDAGKFVTPSLRNVKLTAPYMHDGRFETLAQVIEHYDHGVAPTATLDPNLAKHPREGLRLSATDKQALIAFLESLTDNVLASQ